MSIRRIEWETRHLHIFADRLTGDTKCFYRETVDSHKVPLIEIPVEQQRVMAVEDGHHCNQGGKLSAISVSGYDRTIKNEQKRGHRRIVMI